MRNYGLCAGGPTNRFIDVDSMVMSIVIANLSHWLALIGFRHESYESEDACSRLPFNKQRSSGRREGADGGKQSNKEGEGQARKQLPFQGLPTPRHLSFPFRDFIVCLKSVIFNMLYRGPRPMTAPTYTSLTEPRNLASARRPQGAH